MEQTAEVVPVSWEETAVFEAAQPITPYQKAVVGTQIPATALVNLSRSVNILRTEDTHSTMVIATFNNHHILIGV